VDSGFADALGASARLDASTPSAVLRDGDRWIVATEPVDVVSVSGDTAFDALDALEPGFWAGFLAFELGHGVEHVRTRSTVADRDTRLPDLVLVRFARRRFAPVIAARPSRTGRVADPSVGLGVREWTTLDHDDYTAGVEVVLDHVRAGDCYQVNLTRTIGWERPADPMALFRALTLRTPAPHSALLRLPVGAGTVTVVSASPERFLAWHGTHIETRPIKGTASDAAVLERSSKDHAENVMIVDLARNDLGRVCEPGSIDVPALCATETHPGLVHLVSTVRGVVRPDVGLGQVIRATFPPASVTGAPKPRVLQIIEDLEPTRRGVYCGAVGWLDTEQCRGDLAVAIRTFVIEPHRTTLGVGSGIVADSIPALEWDETRLKARRLLAAAGASEPQRVAVTT
jgi:para-aminobenzoate synthetase component 1